MCKFHCPRHFVACDKFENNLLSNNKHRHYAAFSMVFIVPQVAAHLGSRISMYRNAHFLFDVCLVVNREWAVSSRTAHPHWLDMHSRFSINYFFMSFT